MFGIVSDAEFESLLVDKSPQAKVVDINRGRGNVREIPIEIKKVISQEAIEGTRAKELSELFGVSESSISAYKNDATSTTTYHEKNQELKEHNDNVRDGIVTSARSKLMSALESITEEKLNDVKVRDAAGIAKDMSAIIKNLEPYRENGNGQLNQQFIFYAPKTRSESDFEVIEARE